MSHYPNSSSAGGALAASNKLPRSILRALCCVFIAAALLGGACSGTAPQQPEAPPKEPLPTPKAELSPEAQIAFNHLSLGEALDKGDNDTAMAALDQLIAMAPSPELYMQRAILYDQAQQRDKAITAAREGAHKYPGDYALHVVWAELLDQSGKADAALAILASFEKRYKAMPRAEQKTRISEIGSLRQFTTYILLNARRFDEASAYIKAVPQNEITPTLLFYEVVLLRNQGQQKLANTKLYELLKNHPDYTDGWLTLASDMEKAGNYKSAVRFYNKALEISPVTEIYLRMLSSRIKSGDAAGAQAQVISSPFSSEVKIQAALLFMDAKEYKSARAILLTLQSDIFAADDVALYLAMISYDTGENVQESLERLQDISPDARNRARMMYLKALLHIRADSYPSALESARALRDEYPENKDHWAFLAELYNVTKNYKQAESVTREALEQWPEDVSLMYSQAMSLSSQKKNSQAIQLLEDILLLDESNNLATNALAYTLAEERRDLNKALLLARKALSRDPENTSIMDTLAWVYYQMGSYDEAWANIRLCVSKGVEDPIIWDHYGDIAMARDDKEAARTGYTRALLHKPENKAEIRKKLGKLK